MKPSLAITNDGPTRAGRHVAESPGFDEQNRPITTVDFDYPDDEPEQPEREGNDDVIHLLKCGLLVVIEQKQAALTTAGALVYLLGLFPSQSAAAKATGCNRSTMTRSVRRMKGQLQRNMQRLKKCSKTSV